MKKSLISIFIIYFITIGFFAFDIPKMKGWKLKGKIETYHADNLWEIINGAADAFVSYGFYELNAFDISKGDLFYTVYLYNMATPLNAFGIYRSENSPSKSAEDIGVETQFSDYLTVMLKGKYYLKLETVKGVTTKDNCQSLIEDIANSLPGNNNLPNELFQLPKEDKILDSERFAKENFLGVKELSNCIYAQYKNSKQEYRIFIMLPEKGQTNEKILSKLSQKWALIKIKGLTVFQRVIPYTGPVGIFNKNKFLFGISGFKEKSELYSKILKILKK